MAPRARIAVVTGGNRGLGLETCRRLARLGFAVILGSRDAAKGNHAAETLAGEGLKVTPFVLDVTDATHVEALAAYLAREHRRVDVVVNNAGVLPSGDGGSRPLWETAEADIRAALETNALGPLRLCQALVPMMRRRRYGRIVNVSSGMGQLSDMGRGYIAYRLSKTALNALTRVLAAEVAADNILVNAVCPGWVRTAMGGPNATLGVEQGVDSIVWAATLPDGGPSGGFFHDRQPIPW